MGQARIKRLNAKSTVYHHTSTLRTNLLWMSGEILPEGKMPPVFHPQLGRINTDATMRRPMVDFPPLVWFTKNVSTPKCLIIKEIHFVGKDGETRTLPISEQVANGIALNRFAIGFPMADIPVIPWPEHPGYTTLEGRDLNESARDFGDDPNDWYVSDTATDLMLASEIWFSRKRYDPKLTREDWYLPDMKNMVQQCRSRGDVYIPPSWLSEDKARKLAQGLGIDAMSGRALGAGTASIAGRPVQTIEHQAAPVVSTDTYTLEAGAQDLLVEPEEGSAYGPR